MYNPKTLESKNVESYLIFYGLDQLKTNILKMSSNFFFISFCDVLLS